MRTLLLFLLPWLTAPAPAQDTPETEAVPLDTSRAPLLDHQRLRLALARLQSEHSGIVSLLKVGASRSGLVIEAVRLASGEAGRGRPAMLLVANIDGPQVYTSGLALDHVRRLAEGYGRDDRITRLLDTTTIYVIPRANPDGAEARFESPLAERRGTGAGVDDDRDGLRGEDPPVDVDGDGNVTWMRVPDPEGTWMPDPTDPRANVEAVRAKGQRGSFRLVREGRDTDGDEEASEDAPTDAVVNQNFAAGWEEHGPSAGLFPTDEPETRALCEFVLAREDLQLVLTYGELDNLLEAPKSIDDDAPDSKRVPASGVRATDAGRLAEYGRKLKQLTDIKAKGTDAWAGSFQRWSYDHRGLTSLALVPWSIPLDAEAPKDEAAEEEGAGGEEEAPGDEAEKAPDAAAMAKDGKDEPKPSDDAKRLRWIDAEGLAERHLGWTEFEHPELGPVEIGGFAPYALHEPEDATRVELADGLLEFLLECAESLARIDLVDVGAAPLGGGLHRVEATVVNAGYLPLVTTWGERTRTVRPARVHIRLPEGAQVIAGEARLLVHQLDGLGGREELTWLVRGASPGTIGISVETDNAGAARAVPKDR